MKYLEVNHHAGITSFMEARPGHQSNPASLGWVGLLGYREQSHGKAVKLAVAMRMRDKFPSGLP